jgi:hypothetical protein
MTCHEFTLIFGKFSSKYQLAFTFDHDLEITDYAWLWNIVVCNLLQHEINNNQIYISILCKVHKFMMRISQGPKSSKSLPPLSMSPCEFNLHHTISNIITTSVACAIGPSVNSCPNYLNMSFEILLNFQ